MCRKTKGMITMAEEIKKDEILSEEELDNVAGGTRLETYGDGNELYKRGLLSEEDALHSAPVRDILHQMGYSGYNKNGNTISREQFWKNFDAENGTQIIR